MKQYPNVKPDHMNIRDGNKNFVAQIRGDELHKHITEYGLDYEFQGMDGTKWIPLVDIVLCGDDKERASAALTRVSPETLLIQASKEGDYELIKYALAADADIHFQEDRALYFAVLHEHERCVKLLINRGAHATGSGIVAAALRNGNRNILESFSRWEDVSMIEIIEAPTARKLPPAPARSYSSPPKPAGFRCSNCGQFAGVKMDAGERGKAFGGGSPLGAFLKTYRCTSCAFLW